MAEVWWNTSVVIEKTLSEWRRVCRLQNHRTLMWPSSAWLSMQIHHDIVLWLRSMITSETVFLITVMTVLSLGKIRFATIYRLMNASSKCQSAVAPSVCLFWTSFFGLSLFKPSSYHRLLLDIAFRCMEHVCRWLVSPTKTSVSSNTLHYRDTAFIDQRFHRKLLLNNGSQHTSHFIMHHQVIPII